VSLVALIVGGGGVAALALFGHEANSALEQLSANAAVFERSTHARSEPFEIAAVEFEMQERHEGIRSIAFIPTRGNAVRPPLALPPGPPPGAPRAARPPGANVAVIDGVVQHNVPLRGRFETNRFGYAIATLFGVRATAPVPFGRGIITFVPDSSRFESIAMMIVAAIVIAGLVAGLLAAFVGNFITQQAIRPLIDVTEALQRFAARDFRAQPIAVAGRSDFDVLAHAYNAASAQVADAFAERDAAEAQMRQFVADAGHELRTPLTIVLGYIDLLRRRSGPNDERSKFIFASIAAEGRRMRTLVDNLVLLAKLEGDDQRPIEPFDLATLVGEIADVRRGLDPNVRIAVDAKVDGTVVADRSEIHEAIANVVDNAIKYAPGSPVRIELDSPVAGALTLSVSDEGPGIPADDRTAIFERFFRGASRGEVEGSGLGLAIAKRALERAGGSIALDATAPRGTRFVMTLRAERVQRRAAVG
jgi:two-component system OmpR family sensor kinase